MAVIIMLELKKHYISNASSTTSSSVEYYKLIYSYYGVFHINRIMEEKMAAHYGRIPRITHIPRSNSDHGSI